MISTLNTNVKSAGFCDNVYTASAEGVNWLSRNAKVVGNGAWEGVKNVASAVSTFFVLVAQKLAVYLSAAKDAIVLGLSKARDTFTALPKEAKIVGAVSIVVTALVTALACRCLSSKSEAPANTEAAAAVSSSSSSSSSSASDAVAL